MSMRDAKTVFTQDISSGRVHERVYLDGRMLASEACNTDDAGNFRVIEDIDGISNARLCKRCFPQPANDVVPG